MNLKDLEQQLAYIRSLGATDDAEIMFGPDHRVAENKIEVVFFPARDRHEYKRDKNCKNLVAFLYNKNGSIHS